MEDTENQIITFRGSSESFLSFDILYYITWTGLMYACICKYVYSHYYQYLYILLICTIFFFAILMAYPSGYKYIYYRWLVFKYNKTTEFVIDIENKKFSYKHDKKEITFYSSDIEKWSYGIYGRFRIFMVIVVRIKLKNGTKVNLSSCIGTIKDFLQENEELLGIPRGTYRYSDNYRSLKYYIKNEICK